MKEGFLVEGTKKNHGCDDKLRFGCQETEKKRKRVQILRFREKIAFEHRKG
jgi:hypothetical protein